MGSLSTIETNFYLKGKEGHYLLGSLANHLARDCKPLSSQKASLIPYYKINMNKN